MWFAIREPRCLQRPGAPEDVSTPAEPRLPCAVGEHHGGRRRRSLFIPMKVAAEQRFHTECSKKSARDPETRDALRPGILRQDETGTDIKRSYRAERAVVRLPVDEVEVR